MVILVGGITDNAKARARSTEQPRQRRTFSQPADEIETATDNLFSEVGNEERNSRKRQKIALPMGDASGSEDLSEG